MADGPIAGFGFSTSAASADLSDLDRVLGRIEETGASHAELTLCAAHVIAGGRIVPPMRRRLEAACARRTLRYTVHGALTVNFMDTANLAAHEAVCRAMLELTGAVGASLMVHHPGLVAAAERAEIARRRAVETATLRRMGEVAAGHGTRLAVETLFVETDRRWTADPHALAAQLREVAHPAVVGTLDVSHTRIMTGFLGTSFEGAVAAFAPVSGHVHLHDSFGRPTTIDTFYHAAERAAFGMGDLHLPLGWGDIPFAELLPGLPFLPGTVLNVELPPKYWAEVDACAATARTLVEAINAVALGQRGRGPG